MVRVLRLMFGGQCTRQIHQAGQSPLLGTAHQTINHNGSSTQVDVGWAVYQTDSPSWP
ncbi:MAG: hypothetical protein F6K56_12715 [Moorea sp. SIO3G5]|nr:hypothetical protein [Moorena sp. SIO3G5]